MQGEREFAADNKSLGRFILDGIPPASRGIPQVEVIFDIDANGILKVTAKDKTSGKEQKITIQGGTGLSKDEVEKMVHESEAHAAEDRQKKEQVEARNMADNLCYTAEKALRDAGDKVPADVKTEVESKVKSLRDALQTASTEELKSKTQELSLAMQKIGQSMQPDPTDQGPKPDDKSNGPVEGEVVN